MNGPPPCNMTGLPTIWDWPIFVSLSDFLQSCRKLCERLEYGLVSLCAQQPYSLPQKTTWILGWGIRTWTSSRTFARSQVSFLIAPPSTCQFENFPIFIPDCNRKREQSRGKFELNHIHLENWIYSQDFPALPQCNPRHTQRDDLTA